MSSYDLLSEIKVTLDKCMKCGNCQAVCPLYREMTDEVAVARGKISLVEAILEGQIDITEGIKERMELCLMCGACTANCPNGVKVGEIMLSARAAIKRDRGLPFAKSVVFSVLSKPSVLDLGIETGKHFQDLVFKKHPFKNSGYPRMPIGLDMRRIIPRLAAKTLRKELPVLNAVPEPRMKVAYFTGCTINYIYTNIGIAVVDVLNKNSVDVIIPPQQHCCGTPIYTSGDINTARVMAKSNLDILLELNVEAIITSCATCGGALKNDYLKLLTEDQQGYAEKAEKVSQMVFDISDFLLARTDYDKIKMEAINCSVTYHDPCHLNRSLGVSKQPRAIIGSIPGVEFREMNNPGRCCGAAGSFSLTHYDMSMAVHRHKAEDIQATGADTVITGCPACMMQLEDGINRFGLNNQIMHTAELLNLAYKRAE